MACLNMVKNNDTQQGLCMGPRISLSNDFGDHHQGALKVHSSNYKEAPVSADFEFSVTNQSLVANNIADEFFFKGKLLPLKERKPTLRDELLVDDDDNEADLILPRVPKSSPSRWKDRLGLRRSNIILSKKGDKNEAVLQSIVEEEKNVLDVVHDKGHLRKKSLDMFSYGGLV